MPSFDIVKSHSPDKSFRVESARGAFDLQMNYIEEHFQGNIDIENIKWNVGLIVGGSGSGKTTIAKEVFGDAVITQFEYSASSVLDDMPTNVETNEIFKMFSSVGFGSAPSWLKPYSVLSNGEKMRVDLARALLENRELVVFDEFTSVVDRTVAQTGAYAVQKAVRKQDRKFVAVSCHYDVIDWLLPDWIYDASEHLFMCAVGNTADRKLKSISTKSTDNKKLDIGIYLKSIII